MRLPHLEGRVKPVYFSADAAVFADTLFPVQTVLYENVMRLGYPCLTMVELQQQKTVQAFIAKPTIFRKENMEFLVYPKEHIFITANDSNDYIPTFSTVNQKKARNGELLVLKTFQELEERPKLPILPEYSFQNLVCSVTFFCTYFSV